MRSLPLRILRLAGHTLRGRLVLALVLPLLALTGLGAAADYFTARRLTGASFDRSLANIAIGLAARVETDRDSDLPTHLLATAQAVHRIAPGNELFYLVLDAADGRISGDPRLRALVAPAAAAAANPRFQDGWLDARPVRSVTYDYAGADGRATIVVAETLEERAAAAREILLLTTATNLAMALAVTAVAAVAIRYALRPLGVLSTRVKGHEVQELRAISLRGVPVETRPLVRAINRLMVRVRRNVQARQAFVNNTAHQLRTPLAGLGAQVELVSREPLPAAAYERVQEIRHSVERLSHLTQQMLSMARASGDPDAAAPAEDVQLPDLLHDTASACLDLALSRQVDLGFDAAPGRVRGSAWMLRELLANLVHNAIVHTPVGTVVTVRCGVAPAPEVRNVPAPFLEVEDDGPGIAPHEREHVFGRFVRLSADDQRGTGLGLAIVREIAHRHAALVTILDGEQGRGTRVRVVFTG